MNEQIKELAVQAKLEHCVSHVRLQDFAELIISECAKLASEETSLPHDSYSEKIKQHFGVKNGI